jgi:hypothetical protein
LFNQLGDPGAVSVTSRSVGVGGPFAGGSTVQDPAHKGPKFLISPMWAAPRMWMGQAGRGGRRCPGPVTRSLGRPVGAGGVTPPSMFYNPGKAPSIPSPAGTGIRLSPGPASRSVSSLARAPLSALSWVMPLKLRIVRQHQSWRFCCTWPGTGTWANL